MIEKAKPHQISCAIREIKISNYHGLRDLVIDDIATDHENLTTKDPQWVFLTGKNGYGKTSLLQAITIGLNGNRDGDVILCEQDGTGIRITLQHYDSQIVNHIAEQGEFEEIYNIAAYGSARLNKGAKVGDENSTATYNLFNTDGKLLDIETYLKEWFNDRTLHHRYEETAGLLVGLLSPYIDKIEVVVDRSDHKYVKYHEMQSVDGELISFNEMAAGYKNILAMFGDMIIRLRQAQENPVESLQDLSGIVIIDEFDLHLHPQWQRDLVKKLTDLFPKVQFIVSTHSPIPLLGAPPDKTVIISIERSLNEGVVVKRLRKIEKELAFLLPNQLLTSEIFGLEEIENVYLPDNELDKVSVEDKYEDIEKHKKLRKDLELRASNKELFPDDLFDNEKF